MFLTGLARVAREAGLTAHEYPGWKTRTAHKGGMSRVVGVIWHHTATPANLVTTKNNPTRDYMVSGLGYPLANYGLGWDGSLDVLAAGTGAHAGKGSYKGVPNNDGNRYMIGVEVEGTIGLTWSAAQLEAAARLGAQLNREFGTQLLHIGHYEWAPGRKTDPTGIPGGMNALRAAIKRGHWATPIITQSTGKTTAQEDDLSAEDVKNINDRIDKLTRAVEQLAGGQPTNLRDTTAWRVIDGQQKATSASRVLQEIHGLAAEGARAAGATEQALAAIFERPRENENIGDK